jgi:hypothetical protein
MKIFKDYSLSITLATLFVVSWLGHGYFQFKEFVNHAHTHGEELQLQEFWYEFAASTLENWQSEFLQLLAFVVLTTYLIHKNSPESRDSNEKMQATLERIDKKLSVKRK